nr:PREDICTED: uncharacterized protein DKFZp434B061-like [Linepithema humile]
MAQPDVPGSSGTSTARHSPSRPCTHGPRPRAVWPERESRSCETPLPPHARPHPFPSQDWKRKGRPQTQGGPAPTSHPFRRGHRSDPTRDPSRRSSSPGQRQASTVGGTATPLGQPPHWANEPGARAWRGDRNLPLTVPCHRGFEVRVPVSYQRLGQVPKESLGSSCSLQRGNCALLAPQDDSSEPPHGEPSHHNMVAHNERAQQRTSPGCRRLRGPRRCCTRKDRSMARPA